MRNLLLKLNTLLSFIITKTGAIEDIETKGPELSKQLQEEARRVIKLLPEFIPGVHNNNATNVSFSFPISFNLQAKELDLGSKIPLEDIKMLDISGKKIS